MDKVFLLTDCPEECETLISCLKILELIFLFLSDQKMYRKEF